MDGGASGAGSRGSRGEAMISFKRTDWPQLRIGRKRKRSCWFSWTWTARGIEVWIARDRIGGHIWWLSFWLTRHHLTLSMGPWLLWYNPHRFIFEFGEHSGYRHDMSGIVGALLLATGGLWLLLGS